MHRGAQAFVFFDEYTIGHHIILTPASAMPRFYKNHLVFNFYFLIKTMNQNLIYNEAIKSFDLNSDLISFLAILLHEFSVKTFKFHYFLYRQVRVRKFRFPSIHYVYIHIKIHAFLFFGVFTK